MRNHYDPERVVTISYSDALYLEGVMIWVREHGPAGEDPNEDFRQVELRLNMAVARSHYQRGRSDYEQDND